MVRVDNERRAQSLPLNTIVIAILVIIVLLVIVIFFTTNVGKSGDQLEQNSASKCSATNPAISALGFEKAEPVAEGTCNGENQDIISMIPTEKGKVCCGTKKSNN